MTFGVPVDPDEHIPDELGGTTSGSGSIDSLRARSKKSSLAKECTNDVCGPSSYSDYNSANSLATISTIGGRSAVDGSSRIILSGQLS